ncbi:7-cyano-7-deazaguanine synthase [Burkholderia gladioli]|uniref:7-cyano-7-deazaguanine synthase n=1 Tax=Burkholderia gladioli TaxID=28095 RepID=UPI0016412255|nr:7-cyano-7-deazaguanine synthase [Burkholderia gladioli]
MKSALLLSGGQDSVALAYWLRPSLAISVNYGQLPAEAEMRAAVQVCKTLGISHTVVTVDCSSLGSGDLAGSAANAAAPSSEWWPYRNQLLVTLAASSALSFGADELLLGAVSTDSSHADGRQEFYDSIDRLMRIQEGGIRVRAPAIGMTSVDLIRESKIPLDLLLWAHSCHRSNLACGHCRGCLKHKNVMYELGQEPF